MATATKTGDAATAMLAVVRVHGAPDALAWLERGWPRPGEPLARGLFFGFYAGAGRRLGPARPPLTEAESSALLAAGVARPERFSLSELARVGLLLAAAAELDAGSQLELANEAYRKGDTAERVALLKGLALLPEPARFVELAAEACRTHVADVFEALACDNPFPARHMPEPAFNQLVMKALFLEVPLVRVIDWERRNNAELRRMVVDYAAERRAAGRDVPTDIARIDTPMGEAR